MPTEVLQRLAWTGVPVELGDWFSLAKQQRMARAAIHTHALGWEMRLFIEPPSELVRTQVCRTQEEVFDTAERWKESLLSEGWTSPDEHSPED